MKRVLRLYRSSVGKKMVMGVTGLMLFGFVVGVGARDVGGSN